ncbi:sensor histidine kinase [Hymenobacter rubripertinctus]|uniref:Oxygen sensor histidine kinase NreB n=1 Tax=Hymenobacter rubripertinctus TaxID=2029981 RepID=A0A418R7P6_9BACT|nr:7TM diverse intracellular signaling domain-containing protein [Hymenobacter rubripertinctus]RIY13409.1 hypothetical protein D0T11_02940 [Hymenobacter rubripertinctus]
MRYLLIFLILTLMLPGRAARAARPDTLRLLASNDGPFHPYLAYCFDSTTQPATGARAARLWQLGRFRPLPAGRVFQAGFTHDRLWLRAVVVNTLPQRTRFVWSIYTGVDSVALFGTWPGAGGALPPPRGLARASGWDTAENRPVPSRILSLPFWLDARARAVLYLRVDNRTGALYLPTDITTAEDFLQYESTYFTTKNWAWLLGLYVGSTLFSLILFVFLRDRIYLWYGAYVLLSTWFLLMEDGLEAVLLPPALHSLGWMLGQYTLLMLALACELRVLALFIRLRQGWPRLHRLSRALSNGAAGYALLYGIGYTLLPAHSQLLPWLNGVREFLTIALLLGSVLLLVVVGSRGRAPQRRLAGYYSLTYAIFCYGSINFLLNRSGLSNIHLANPNALAWGLALELMGLSALLIGRFRQSLRQTTALRLRHLHESATAGQRLIAAQDEEREALARELHDALAPGLTALHLAWQGRQVQHALSEAPAVLHDAHHYTETLLRQLRHDVRTLSQALLPPPGEQLPLPAAIGLLADTLNLADEGPLISWHCDPSATGFPLAVQATAYRIVAELLHNALRHAQAQSIRVDVRHQAAGLRLCVQDDGQGFDLSSPPGGRGGLGLRSIQARVGYLRGLVVISSPAGQGTTVTVELPF